MKILITELKYFFPSLYIKQDVTISAIIDGILSINTKYELKVDILAILPIKAKMYIYKGG